MKQILIETILFVILLISSLTAQNGIIKTYYPTGETRAALSFVDNIYDGTSYWFYKNGNIEIEKTYNSGKLNGWVKYYYESGLVKEEYYVSNGVKDGLNKEYYENGALKSIKDYSNGILIKITNLDFDSNYRAPVDAYNAGNRQYAIQKKKDLLLCDVEICPIPIGGMRSIQDSLVYPEHALLYGLEGIVTLIATVNESGDVENIEIIQGLGLGCDAAASAAVIKNKFLPGQEDGKSVESHLTMNVEFWLNEDSKIEFKQYIGDARVPENAAKIIDEIIAEDTADTRDTLITVSKKEQPREIGEARNFICSIEECPSPKGGLTEILENLEIPVTAKRVGLKGEVVILATIDENGFVRDTEIIKGMGYGCNEAAESALYNTEFFPGKDNGKVVSAQVKIIIPILQDEP
ncbi:TonB family protein [Bacteroidota bacterium]